MSLPLSIPAQPGIMFRDPGYLAQVPLTSQTALEYFSLSPFFSRQSTNEVLRMQSIADAEGSSSRRQPKALEEALRRFRGTEYVLAHSNQPDLFIVHRRRRWGDGLEEVEVEQAYYIADGNILLAPDLYTLLGNRLLTTLSALHESMSYAHQALPPFDPRSGVAWKVPAAETSGAAAAQASDDDDNDESDSDDEDRHGVTSGATGNDIALRRDSVTKTGTTARAGDAHSLTERGKRKPSLTGDMRIDVGDVDVGDVDVQTEKTLGGREDALEQENGGEASKKRRIG